MLFGNPHTRLDDPINICSKLLKLPISLGSSDQKLFHPILSRVKFVSFPRDTGIGHASLSPSRVNFCRSLRSPIQLGMGEVSFAVYV